MEINNARTEQVEITQEAWEESIRNETALGINSKVEYGVDTENKIFPEPFFFEGLPALNFKNCRFKEKAVLTSYSPSVDTYFVDCIFEKGFHLGDTTSDNKIVFACISSARPSSIHVIFSTFRSTPIRFLHY